MSLPSTWLEIVLTLFTGIEACAFVLLFRLERQHFASEDKRELRRDGVELNVEVELRRGGTQSGELVIWVENSGPGTAFIRTAALVVTHLTKGGIGARGECSLFGNRTLAGFSSVQVPANGALREMVEHAKWVRGKGPTGFALTASVVVRTTDKESLPGDSKMYIAAMSGSGPGLARLDPVPERSQEGAE